MSLPPACLQHDRGPLLDDEIQPVMIVFDSRIQNHQKRHSKIRRKPKKKRPAVSQPAFAFINSSKPEKNDEVSRRLIKTHVMQNVLRRVEKQKVDPQIETHMDSGLVFQEEGSLECIYDHQNTRWMERSPQAPLSNLIAYPIKTQPYMRRLIHNCAFNALPVHVMSRYSNAKSVLYI